MLSQADYNLTISTATADAISQAKYDVFALLHKSAFDNHNERMIFSKYAYDKVIIADPTQASQYASFFPTAPTIASVVTDAQALFDYISA